MFTWLGKRCRDVFRKDRETYREFSFPRNRGFARVRVRRSDNVCILKGMQGMLETE